MHDNQLIDKIISLAKRRGFIFPDSEIYGGLANSWDFGHLGVELKNNIKEFWWRRYVRSREDIYGLESALIMNARVWTASGHLKEFRDPLIECKNCHNRFRAGEIKSKCPDCNGREFTSPRQFNLLFKTFLGPVEDKTHEVYMRPETAQGMFVSFKNMIDTLRPELPFGIAQIGKAFRNEITPGNFIFRTREFEMMEIEYFIRKEEWEKYFNIWKDEMLAWIKEVGIDQDKICLVEIPKEERAHYSKKTVDIEFEFPFGQKELYGLAYRSDFDLVSHSKFSGIDLVYRDPKTGEEFIPHVIEPSWGVERTMLAIFVSCYHEEKGRVVLSLKPKLAPYKAAVFPLLANRKQLVRKAREIYEDLLKEFPTFWDDRGNIGKRYYAQDEIGTPFCITIDFESLEKNDVTLRYRDSMHQIRIKIPKLKEVIKRELEKS